MLKNNGVSISRFVTSSIVQFTVYHAKRYRGHVAFEDFLLWVWQCIFMEEMLGQGGLWFCGSSAEQPDLNHLESVQTTGRFVGKSLHIHNQKADRWNHPTTNGPCLKKSGLNQGIQGTQAGKIFMHAVSKCWKTNIELQHEHFFFRFVDPKTVSFLRISINTSKTHSLWKNGHSYTFPLYNPGFSIAFLLPVLRGPSEDVGHRQRGATAEEPGAWAGLGPTAVGSLEGAAGGGAAVPVGLGFVGVVHFFDDFWWFCWVLVIAFLMVSDGFVGVEVINAGVLVFWRLWGRG